MTMIEDVLKSQEQVTVYGVEVWCSTDDLLSLFEMDPMRDVNKDSSPRISLKTWKPRETSLRELSKRSVKSMGRLSRKY
jgi:hypothetical protein